MQTLVDLIPVPSLEYVMRLDREHQARQAVLKAARQKFRRHVSDVLRGCFESYQERGGTLSTLSHVCSMPEEEISQILDPMSETFFEIRAMSTLALGMGFEIDIKLSPRDDGLSLDQTQLSPATI